MTNDPGILSNKSIYTRPISVEVENGTQTPVKHIGAVTLNSNIRPLVLNSVYHCPNIIFNLMSIQKLDKDNNCTDF